MDIAASKQIDAGGHRSSGSGNHEGRADSSGRTRRSANSTTDHDEIRRWFVSHGGQPATLRRMAPDHQPRLLRDFPGCAGQDRLEHISWEKLFQKFEESHLAFLYQGGEKESRYCIF